MTDQAINQSTDFPAALTITRRLAKELSVRDTQIEAAIGLLDEGATVPFIARYRKELTGGLDDTVLRELEQRLSYLRDLEARRQTVLDSITEQDKLTDELAAQIQAADTRQRLEDLYAPYRPKRRTRAQIAREAGLQALVDAILADSKADPLSLAHDYINQDAGFADGKAALNGARDILAETWSEQADLLSNLRDYLWQHGFLYASVVAGKEEEGANFRDWFDFHEPLRKLPSHRVLALLRGRQQGVLSLKIGLDPESETLIPHPCTQRVANVLGIPADFSRHADAHHGWLAEVCRWTWRVRLLPSFETELMARLRDGAEQEAIRVFAGNLRDLLLAAPAGARTVLGLDPGIRTGVKVAAIDHTGKVLETATIYPFQPRRDKVGSLATLKHLVTKYHIELVAIGNGTGSRETEKLVGELRQELTDHTLTHLVVSEAGASVYSASEIAAKEFPDMDVSLRGAVSIARRLQDPLAELVKIEPKAIGVGQYQHDVNQRELAGTLDTVIEDCVNAVGVDVNTASAALLSRVAGLTALVADNIVKWRDAHGVFDTRQALLDVPRFGPKTFEQAAGFLRIRNGSNPLDGSAVHPEAYPVVKRILERIASNAQQVIGRPEALQDLSPKDFTDKQFGLPTVKDIFSELKKPGRDPRPAFEAVKFTEGVHSLTDLKEGMQLEGVVTNVANFGAFVDIGVHQDGLVHISALTDTFVKDPRDVVRVGQTVKVRVIDVDVQRKRIALSMRRDDHTKNQGGQAAKPHRKKAPASHRTDNKPRRPQGKRTSDRQAPSSDSAMAAAFARLRRDS